MRSRHLHARVKLHLLCPKLRVHLYCLHTVSRDVNHSWTLRTWMHQNPLSCLARAFHTLTAQNEQMNKIK